MQETRRAFMIGIAAAGAFAATSRRLHAQRPIIPPPPPEPAEKQNPAYVHPNPGDAAAKRALLLRNEKEFREGVDRLYELTSNLRDELQKTPTTDVFSLRIVKQTEQIEKLAKLLKSKAKSP